MPEENSSEDIEYFVEYDGKTVPVDKNACCKKISGLQNGTEYTFSLYGQKIKSGKKGYVSTANATPSEDGIDMADSVHQGYAVWFNLYERKDKKTLVANNTNDGRIVWPSELASAYDQSRDVSAYEDNYTEVEKLIVRVRPILQPVCVKTRQFTGGAFLVRGIAMKSTATSTIRCLRQVMHRITTVNIL